MKRTVLVKSNTIQQLAQVLTGYGRIVSMDHEGTIVYELEGEDAFELGRQAAQIQCELQSYDTGVELISATSDRKR